MPFIKGGRLVTVTSSSKHSRRIFMMATWSQVSGDLWPHAVCKRDVGSWMGAQRKFLLDLRCQVGQQADQNWSRLSAAAGFVRHWGRVWIRAALMRPLILSFSAPPQYSLTGLASLHEALQRAAETCVPASFEDIERVAHAGDESLGHEAGEKWQARTETGLLGTGPTYFAWHRAHRRRLTCGHW